MEDSEPAEDGLLAGLRWNRSARDQAQLKHKIRDLPGLLKHGLHLRKKSVSIFKPTADGLSVLPCFYVCLTLATTDGFIRSTVTFPDTLSVLGGCFVTPSRLRCFHFVTSITVAEAVCACLRVCVCATSIITNCCWTSYLHTPVVKATLPPPPPPIRFTTHTPTYTNKYTHLYIYIQKSVCSYTTNNYFHY